MIAGGKPKRKLATLTPEEERVWEKAFGYYVDDEGLSDEEADARAWQDLVAEFPRLAEFDGAK